MQMLRFSRQLCIWYILEAVGTSSEVFGREGAGEEVQDLWRFAFFEFFETVVQLMRYVFANVVFFETVVHLVAFRSCGELFRRSLGRRVPGKRFQIE